MFKDVSESYPTDGDIVVRYVNKSGQESSEDTIGLFVIGWKKVSEAVAVVRAEDHVVEEGTGDRRILFSSTLFSHTITHGQFYQLCYINYSNHPTVIGASCPFCIRRPSTDDMVMLPGRLSPRHADRDTDDDDDEFIVVKSEQALVQERLQSLVTNNGLLDFQCKSLVHKLRSVEQELSGVKEELTRVRGELSRVKGEKGRMEEELCKMRGEKGRMEEELSRVKEEKEKMSGQVRTGQETVQHVTHLLSEIRRKESERESVVERVRQENQQLRMEMSRGDSARQMEIEGLRQERITGKRKEEQMKSEHSETMTLLSSLLDEKERWIGEKENLLQLHASYKAMVDSAKEDSVKLASEKEQVSNYLRQTSEELARKSEELARKESEVKELEKWKREREELESEVARCQSENGELKEMIHVLQSDLRESELRVESQAKSSASLTADRQATIHDLTQRLKKAAEEYVQLKRSKVKMETKYEKLKTKVDVSSWFV